MGGRTCGSRPSHACLRGAPAAISRSVSASAPEQGFRHEAFLYSGEGEFLAGVVPFVRDAVAAGEPVVVALDPDKLQAVRSALGDDSARVVFADIREIGENPARLIPAWREFVDARGAPGRRIWGVGEPIWA